jgi:hypothetical protein
MADRRAPDTILAGLEERAHHGALTPDDVHFVIHHLGPHNPPRARVRALEIAAAHLRATADAMIIVELIRIAEDPDEEDADVRTAAIRALAAATGYHGQRMHVDL